MSPDPVSIVEGYVPGCIGRIAQLHATYYARTNGFGREFEAKVASESSAFVMSFDPGRDGLWLAAAGDSIEGSIAIDGSHAGETEAHLRWFLTSDALRGQGVGTRLLQRALEFTDRRGFEKVYLWTFAGLAAARHLYEAAGFALVHEAPGSQWGTVVVEQRFERARR